MQNVLLKRCGETVIMEQADYESIVSDGYYITLNKLKKVHKTYCQVMVCKKQNGKIVYRTSLARHLLKPPRNKHTDHIDQDPLNNVRSNLRFASPSQNGANRVKVTYGESKHKGVRRGKTGKWRVLCIKDTIRYSAYGFSSEKEAAAAYDQLAMFLHGEFASTNFGGSNANSKAA